MFRVTPHQQLITSLQRFQAQSSRTQDVQNRISSGLRILRPSDDPVGQREVLNLSRLLTGIDSELSTIGRLKDAGSQSYNQIQSAQQLVVQARDIALQARQSVEPTERDVLARQVEVIRDRLVQIGNSNVNGQYLFSGSGSQQPPLSVNESGKVAYAGGTSSRANSPNNVPTAADLFIPTSGTTFEIVGSTGAKLGAGVPVGMGRSDVVLRHTATLYQPGSGIQPGSSSVTDDTVLGPSGRHRVEIIDTSGTGVAGTIALDGGTAVAFTSADTNLLVTGPNGTQIRVDTTGITPGFNDTVELEGQGTIALDDGTETTLDFASIEQLTNASGTQIQYIDTTDVLVAGTDRLEPTSGTDLFASLNLLIDDIRNGTVATGRSELDHRLDELSQSHEQLLLQLGRQSVSLQYWDRQQTNLEAVKLTLQERLGDVQSADLADAVLRLQEQQSQTEFSLSSAVRTLSISILDFLA